MYEIDRLSKLYDNACLSGSGRNCVGFVCVDVHSLCIICGNSANYIAEDSRSVLCFDLYIYNVLILYAKLFCVGRGKVDMSFCDDNALAEFHFSAGTYQLAGTGAGNVAAFSYGSGDTCCTGIGSGKLNLICASYRSEDRTFKGVLGTYYLYLFLAGELTRLGKILFLGEPVTLAEEYLKGLFGNVDMAC